MGEQLDHVLRPAIPWRTDGGRTECGLSAANYPVITRDEFVSRVAAQGQKRSAMSTCMTCWETARRWKSWDQDPLEPFRREVENYRDGDRLRDELRSIAALIEAHRDEFQEYLSGLSETVSLDARRRQRRAAGGRRG